MSFTQQKKMNFIHCDGCEKRCELGAVKIISMMGDYYPKIGGECIYQYIDKNNQELNDYVDVCALEGEDIEIKVKGIHEIAYSAIDTDEYDVDELTEDDVWNFDMEYVVEPGDFNVWVAGDSASGTPVGFIVK